jgi:DNA-binding MarR family transcriptional regulator
LKLNLGPLAGLVGFHLAQAQLVATRAFDAHVGEPLGLRKVEFSLLLLLHANGPLAPKQLARGLALTAPALTLLMDRLQAQGLLLREPNPQDGRSQHVVLTPAGVALAARAADAAVPMEDGMLEGLSAAEQAMLRELLGKLWQVR